MPKKPTTPMPGMRRPRKATTTANRKPLAAKEVKIGTTKAKMVGGIVPIMSKPKKKMF